MRETTTYSIVGPVSLDRIAPPQLILKAARLLAARRRKPATLGRGPS